MTFVFIGPTWKGENFIPFIKFTKLHTTEVEELQLKVGERINIKIMPGTYCIGTEIGRGQWISCSKNSLNMELEDTQFKIPLIGKQCSVCSRRDFFSCRMTCQGTFCAPTTLRAKGYCDPADTNVYFTHIAGINKVGVSLGLPRRWVEQGSEFAVHIATVPGLEARRIEYGLSQDLELALQIQSRKKLEKYNTIPSEIAIKQLKELVVRSKMYIDEVLATCEGSREINPEIVDLEKYYGKKINANEMAVSQPEIGDEFGGEIISIQGPILIVKTGEYNIGIDMKRLIGKEFEFLDRPAKQNVQTNILDWF